MEYKFYKLCRDDEILYVGQTKEKYLCNRFANHKSDFKKWLNGKAGKAGKLYYYSEDFSFDGVKCVQFDSTWEDLSTTELRERENYWIEKLNPNQTKNFNTLEEAKQYRKEYYSKHI